MAVFCKNMWRTLSLFDVSPLLLLFGVLVLMGELRKDGGRGVEAWHDKYCFSLLGNKYLNDPIAEKEVLNVSGYTGFGHDVYQTESMEAALYPGGSYSHSPEFTQEIFHVKEKNGKILFGWFHLKLTHTGTGFSFQGVVSQAESLHTVDNYPSVFGVGEFVNYQLGNKGDCESIIVGDNSPIPDEAQLGKKNRIPCNYVKNPFHLAGAGLGLQSDGAIIKSFSTHFHMSFPPCGFYRSNQYPLSFRTTVFAHFRSGIPSDDLSAQVKTSYIFFKDHIYGAPDPPPPKDTDMECSVGLMDVIIGTPTASSWVEVIGPNQDFPDLTNFASMCNFDKDGANQLYYGRCSEGKSLDHSPYTCSSTYTTSNPYHTNLPNHTLAAKASAATKDCIENCDTLLKNMTFKGICANSDIGKEVWALRKAHGIGMTFATTFFIPWNNFNTRYMKETYLDKKIAHLPVWYMTHFLLSTNIMGVLLASYATGIWGRTFFGFSMTAPGRIHVFLGWLSAIIFFLTYFSSGFRCKSMEPRYWGICSHFVGGILHYALCIVGMFSSCFIPGSPSGFSDININGYQLDEPLFWAVCLWVLIDTAFHIAMMVSMKHSDRRMALRRKRTFAKGVVPIPILQLDSIRDIPDGRFRKVMYMIYSIIAFAISLGISAVILLNQSDARCFGRTTQIHRESGKLIGVWKFASFKF